MQNIEKRISKLFGTTIEREEDDEVDELEFRVRRLEKLLDRRGVLLSNCVLRSN